MLGLERYYWVGLIIVDNERALQWEINQHSLSLSLSLSHVSVINNIKYLRWVEGPRQWQGDSM